MKLLLNLAFATFALLNLSACSWLFGDEGTFRDRSNDYRKATMEAPLGFPEGIDSEAIDDSYAIPPINDRTTLDAIFVVPSPEPLAEDVDRDTVRINTLGDQRWILVDGTPGQVWPRLRGFLSLNQLGVQRADAVNGIIDTVWLQPSGEDSLRERYRLRIEQGVQRGSSEVYVLQADIRAGEENWPKTSSNTEREYIMVQELAQYLADSAAAVAVSMLAQQAIDSSGKVTLEENADSSPYIKLTLSFTRSWASVGRALEKAGFQIDDLNRSENTYYVHYSEVDDGEEKAGFFSSLFSWGADDEDKQAVAYFVRVKQQSDKVSTISIERQDGKTIAKDKAEKLLKIIKKHLA